MTALTHTQAYTAVAAAAVQAAVMLESDQTHECTCNFSRLVKSRPGQLL